MRVICSITALAVASLALPLRSTAQAVIPPGCQNSTVDVFGPDEARKAREFLSELKAAVKQDDRQKIASMISYPLQVFGKTQKRSIQSRDEFLRGYEDVFSSNVKAALDRQTPNCLFGNWQGVMVGNGEFWYREITGKGYQIVTINLGK